MTSFSTPVILTYALVQGPEEDSSDIHDIFTDNYSSIHRLNEDYHMFFQLPGFKNANSWALHSAMFYFLLTIRGMTVDHRIAHQYHQ